MATRLLIVDDDPDILGFVQRRAKSAGHNVIAVGSAEEALSVITTKGPPDVAVLDVGLPGLNGLQLLRALREQEPMARLPVIFLSVCVQPADIKAGRALGAAYLTKPFIASVLLSKIDDVLLHTFANDW